MLLSPLASPNAFRPALSRPLPPLHDYPYDTDDNNDEEEGSDGSETDSDKFEFDFIDDDDSSETSTPSDRKRSVPQRFISIHARRSFHSDLTRHTKRESTSTPSLASASLPSLSNLTESERAITRGYSDGFLTAKIFAQYGMSRLGFTGQYIQDSLAQLNDSVVAPGREGEYSASFVNGLRDAEAAIGDAVNR